MPALVLGRVSLVVSPLIALMKDQVDSLQAAGVAATFVNSSIAWDEQASRLDDLARGLYRLVYVAPERFRSARFCAALQRAGPALVAVDEAHCISEWGHDFRPDYLRLGAAVAALRPAPVLACTATATPEVRQDIALRLGLSDPAELVRGFRRPNLFLSVERVRGAAHKAEVAAAHLRDAAPQGGSALVYCATRRRTEQVAEALRGRGIDAAAYHAGMDADRRRSIQDRFMSDGVRCVVATSAFGMGVDKSDVRVVIHHDLPRSPEAYYQEIGRGGRDGRPSRCVLLYNHSDLRVQEFLIEVSHPPEELVRSVWRLLADEAARGEGRSPADLAERLPGRVHEAHARSALAVLEQAGAVARAAPGAGGSPFGLCAVAERVEQDRDSGTLGVDFGAVRSRAEREHAKLRRMVLYCTGVQCRHHFLLHWFGDPDDTSCAAACDRCVASASLRAAGAQAGAVLEAEQLLVVRKALSAVARLDGRFGARRVAQVLTGSRDRKLVAAGLDRLPTHGALADWSQDAAVELLHTLAGLGCLEVAGSEYPTVRITPFGRDVMHERTSLAVPWPAGAPGRALARTGAGSRLGGASAPPVAPPLDTEGQALFERLREVRRELAEARGAPAYVVAHDRALWDLVARRPRTVGELEDCHGFGPRRVERYGEAFLRAILEC